MATRKFELLDAKAENLWLCVGMIGPSGGGKTWSALSVAEGIRAISGGDIAVIDTEAGRASHYAKQFRFKTLKLEAPFSPADYQQAIQYCYQQGARTIVVDSMSHEWEGQGGVLDMHEDEVKRLNSHDLRTWSGPKREHDQLKAFVLQTPANFIFCFRAKEKVKPDKRAEGGIRHLGWQPIGDVGWMFEMTICFLFPPLVRGVPEWEPEEPETKRLLKIPEQFRQLFLDDKGKPLKRPVTRAHGQIMKRWADGATTVQAIKATEEYYALKKDERTAQGGIEKQPAPAQEPPKPKDEPSNMRQPGDD